MIGSLETPVPGPPFTEDAFCLNTFAILGLMKGLKVWDDLVVRDQPKA